MHIFTFNFKKFKFRIYQKNLDQCTDWTKQISLLVTKIFGKNLILSQPRSSNLLPWRELGKRWGNDFKIVVDKTIKSHRDVFLKELTTGQKNPSSKGKRLIFALIGLYDDFVVGGLLVFESKKNSNDYHDEMNGNSFYDWFSRILPLLKKKMQ